MTRFRRTFILATLIGLAIGFVLQRARSPELGDVGTGFDETRHLAPLEHRSDGERLEGRVVDPSGAPAGDVCVVVADAIGVHSVWADGDGAFALDGLTAGTVEVHLVALTRRGASQTLELPAPGPVELTAPSAWEPVETLPLLVRSDCSGRVDPAPASGAGGYEVLLTPEADVLAAGLAGLTPRRATVGADGRFAVDGLVHGRYRAALLPPWASGGAWPELVVVGFEHSAEAGALRLPGSAAELVGRVADADDRPIVGALISLRSASDPSRRWPSVESGADGRFRIGDLPGGSYEVRVSAGRASFERSLRVSALRSVTLDVPPLDVTTRP